MNVVGVGVGAVGVDDADEPAISHNELLRNVSETVGKRSARADVRNFVEEEQSTLGSTQVTVGDMLHFLGEKSDDIASGLKRKLLPVTKSKKKPLRPPVDELEQKKVRRAVAFSKSNREVSQWQNFVSRKRVADQLVFPLHQTHVTVEKIGQSTVDPSCSSRLAAPTQSTISKLEMDISELIGESLSEVNVKKTPKDNSSEDRLMSAEEAKERRRELQKHRALVLRYQAKTRRQKRIKSKNYRRLVRSQKIRQMTQYLNSLKEKDPEQFSAVMKRMERDRAKERLTLKHRGGSKFAKRQLIRKTYDADTRAKLNAMHEKGAQLKTKTAVADGDSSDDEVAEKPAVVTSTKTSTKTVLQLPSPSASSTNAWLKPSKKPSKNQASRSQQSSKTVSVTSDVGQVKKVDFRKPVRKAQTLTHPSEVAPKINRKGLTTANRATLSTAAVRELDLATGSGALRPSDDNDDDNDDNDNDDDGGNNVDVDMNSDDEQAYRMTIAEAFVDDDVVQEFANEKTDLLDKERKAREIDLTLPGWGEWTGKTAGHLDVSKRKKLQFTMTKPSGPPRKDSQLDHVILNEQANDAAAAYQVNKLVFPYHSAEQFEQQLAQPIGRHWNTQIAVNELTKPRINAKLGAIIQPPIKAKVVERRRLSRFSRPSNKRPKKGGTVGAAGPQKRSAPSSTTSTERPGKRLRLSEKLPEFMAVPVS